MHPKWSEAFLDAVADIAGTRTFTYVTAVTSIKGNPRTWEEHSRFREALHGNPVRLWSLAMMLEDLYPTLNTTVASSQLGRLLQLLKACGWTKR
jgi:hypothetical protein